MKILSKTPSRQYFIKRSQLRCSAVSHSSLRCGQQTIADLNKPIDQGTDSAPYSAWGSSILMIHLFCYESHPWCFNVFARYRYSKQVCGRLFMCGDISKCQGLNLSRLCSEMLLMIAVPVTVMQPGLKDRSSMARTSEASPSSESCPRISTW